MPNADPDKLQAYIDAVVAKAPPFTPEQRDKLAGIFRASPAHPPIARGEDDGFEALREVRCKDVPRNVADHAAEQVAAFPPMTDEQADRIAAILKGRK